MSNLVLVFSPSCQFGAVDFFHILTKNSKEEHPGRHSVTSQWHHTIITQVTQNNTSIKSQLINLSVTVDGTRGHKCFTANSPVKNNGRQWSGLTCLITIHVQIDSEKLIAKLVASILTWVNKEVLYQQWVVIFTICHWFISFIANCS